MAKPSLEISNRTDFSLLCNARGLTGIAVEVGTDRGGFAVDFMTHWTGRELLCVDPYQPYDEMSHSRECDRMMAVLALQKFWPRVRIYEVASPKAVECVMPWNRPLDFIYIDGSHLYQNVMADLNAWFPLLADNGILAGHDYDTTHPEVVCAVNDWAKAHRLSVWLTNEPLASWYVYKTPPMTLVKRLFISEG